MNRIVTPTEAQPIEVLAPAAKTFTVLSPIGTPPKITKKTAAPRLESLDGKTIYLVDCLFDNSAAFMEQLRQWFAKHLPAVNTQIITPRESWVDDLDMRKRIAADGNAAILGVGL